MDADSFTVYIKTEDIYVYIGKDFEKRFDASNCDSITYSNKRKIIGLMKNELGRKLMKEFAALRPERYNY